MMSVPNSDIASVLIVGAGPGGLAPLFAAADSRKLPSWLQTGVVLAEDTARVGSGEFGQQAINSDSAAEAILDIVMRSEDPTLVSLREHPAVAAVGAYAGGSVPLSLVSDFLHVIGEAMAGIVAQSPRGSVRRNTRALFTQQVSANEWKTQLFDRETNSSEEVHSRSVILATGGHQPQERLSRDHVAGEPLLPRYRGRVLQSGYVLTKVGLFEVAARLRGRVAPRVVIVGGSASAGAVAHALLNLLPEDCTFSEGGISILHRRPLRVFYKSAAEAQADGYDEFGPADVCPLSGSVYRLGGFRLDSRELIMRARGIGGRPAEPRLRLQLIEQRTLADSRRLLDDADLIIAAIGYRPRAIPVFDRDGRPIPLMGEGESLRPLVDHHSRVLDVSGRPLDGLFGIGLATGLPRTDAGGGEANFDGQINSLWAWQHSVGLHIADQVIARDAAAIAGEHAKKTLAPVDETQISKGEPYLVESSNQKAGRIQVLDPAASRNPQIPMIAPNPPRLSENRDMLREIERGGIYSNYGPMNTRFEESMVSSIFKTGSCVTVCNATIGLMMAIRDVLGDYRKPERRLALMPSFTFAATAHAAIWNGLTPLFCDIDPNTWLPCAKQEELLLEKYRGEIAVVVPYATFGNNLDLARYNRLAAKYDVPIVVDAAASIGSLDEDGNAFGAGFPWPVVFSMHATKIFSVGEGGLIYSSDATRVARLRTMGSFGFGSPRTATMIGINSKLTEVTAATALLQLQRFDVVLAKRQALARKYVQELADWQRQQVRGVQQAYSFESVLLPESLRDRRQEVVDGLKARGIGSASYFSPHLAEQPYFQRKSISGSLRVTKDIARRVLTLPLFDQMSENEVAVVRSSLRGVASALHSQDHALAKRNATATTGTGRENRGLTFA